MKTEQTCHFIEVPNSMGLDDAVTQALQAVEEEGWYREHYTLVGVMGQNGKNFSSSELKNDFELGVLTSKTEISELELKSYLEVMDYFRAKKLNKTKNQAKNIINKMVDDIIGSGHRLVSSSQIKDLRKKIQTLEEKVSCDTFFANQFEKVGLTRLNAKKNDNDCGEAVIVVIEVKEK